MPNLTINWLAAHSGNYTPGGNSCAYVVVHNTANTASAYNEACYAHNSQHASSYHYVLDGTDIYQTLSDYDTAWAVGAWSGATQLIRNNQSISIEVCSAGTEFTNDEIVQLRYLVQKLMSTHNIPASNVVRHYDCHTGHKACPAAYVNNDAWYELWSQITKEQNVVNPKSIHMRTPQGVYVENFGIIEREEGYVEIVNQYRNMALDVAGGLSDNGTPVRLWERNDGSAQRWKLKPFGDAHESYYVLEPKCAPGKCLAVCANSQQEGAGLILWEQNGEYGQQFILTNWADQHYRLIARNTGYKCVCPDY